MPLRISQYLPPAVEPVSATEAYAILKGDAVTLESLSVANAIAGARAMAEVETWSKLVYQCMDLYLDEWPAVNSIELPCPPLRKVEFVRYTEIDGEVREFTGFTADTSSMVGRVVLNDNETWPSDDLRPANPINIRFWCGYAVPFTANATTDTITAENHPWVEGDMITSLWQSGGVLPGGLLERKPYFVRDVSGDSFKLALTADGEAIDLTSAGSGSMFIGDIPGAIMVGISITIAGLYETANDPQQSGRDRYEQASRLWFSMASAKWL